MSDNGTFDRMTGKAKESIGKATGDKETETEGIIQQAEAGPRRLPRTSPQGKPQRPTWCSPSPLPLPPATCPLVSEITLVIGLQSHPAAATQRAYSGNSAIKATRRETSWTYK